MLSILITLVVVVAEVTATTPRRPPPKVPIPAPVCRENEVYQNCGTACPLTCDNYKNPPYCIEQCVEGCFCKPGFVRDRNQNCVWQPYCVSQGCGQNEIYQECGTACPLTCENYNSPPQACTDQCVKGCFCQPGFVRDRFQNCRPAEIDAFESCGQNETFLECGTACPLTCDNYNSPPQACTYQCVQGCFCDPGFVRDRNQKCVRQTDCAPPPVCGQNEKYLQCGTACPLTCDNYKNPPKICTANCVEGCFCEAGYVKNRNGYCVKPETCEPVCPAGEKFSECSAHCQETCENYDKPNKICTFKCQPGCVCEAGTVRRKDGQCVPPLECSPQPTCSSTEVYSPCSAHCQPTCENTSSNQTCERSRICIPGCKCIDGLVRRKDGQCVKVEQCSSSVCGQHEIYSDCGTACPLTCDNYNNPPEVCIQVCVQGCFCKAGFLRDRNQKCVKQTECAPRVCGQNEKYSNCGTACPLTCDNYKNPPKICTYNCVEGCFCEAGYVRARNGYCVKPETCEPVCPAGEKFSACSAHCQETCENYDKANKICNKKCQPGCVCEAGTVRRKDGQCVPPLTCSAPVCGQNEKYSDCGTACPLTCDNYNNSSQICTKQCVQGCFCEAGFVRDSNQRCVKPTECTPQTCGQNEIYQVCGTACPLTCDNYKNPPDACIHVCVQGCFCKAGFVRDRNQKCVKQTECAPRVCGQNEKYSKCGTACPLTCDNYKNPPKICTKQCVEGCFCDAGFVRDLNQRCVKPTECTPQLCGQNEIYQDCGTACPLTCDNYNNPPDACIQVCVQGCFCKAGFVRDRNQKCVKQTECAPRVCGQNEKYLNCGTACPLTCDNYKNPPKICTFNCVEGCFCEAGYVRSRDGYCVKPETCEPICPAGEKFSECSAHCQETCENYDQPNRACTKQCQPGCVCKAGTVRRKDGQCVPPLQCSAPVCGQNEKYSDCGTACPLTCDNYKNSSQICTKQCVQGCFCDAGFVRDLNQRCVKPTECTPQECGQNEIYQDCGTACPLTCDNYKNPPDACIQVCVQGCFCKAGFVRDRNQKCVKQTECAPRVCGQNEKYSNCGTACPLTCDNYKNPPKICTANCVEGCFCEAGYVRDRNQRCVKQTECELGPTCSALEQYDACSAHCEPTCETYGKTVACAAYCKPGCRCKNGLVRRNDGQCVKPDECQKKPQCPVNERYVDCVLGLCIPKTCNELGSPVACADIIGPCAGGCVCKENYLRDSDGVCVPQKQCPSCGGDFNATAGCGINCGNLCSNYDKPNNCSSLPLVCLYNACDCKDGFVFDSVTQRCVSPSDCARPPVCSDPNAETVECASQCQPTCATPNPGPCILSCKENGCVCKKGFILSAKGGKCIPVDKCPKDAPCNGDSNAVIKVNPLACPSTCDAPNAQPYCDEYAPEVGCECKPGFLKSSDDDDSKCIKPDECPAGNPCGVNGTFVYCNVNCPDSMCPVNDNRGDIACSPPKPCPNGCACKLNYRKKINDDLTYSCILASDCPPVNCTRPNEIYSPCPSACLRENCEHVNKQTSTCNTLVQNCKPKCICKKGHFRNDKGICIPATQCPNYQQCSDPNAERVECAPQPECRTTCNKPNPGPCILSCALNECVCKKGYILSKEGGLCVPDDQCPARPPVCSDPNAETAECASQCQPTCATPNPGPCILSCKENGCVCKKGFILSAKGGKCIPVDKCPKDAPCNGDSNAVIKSNPLACPSTCDAPNAHPDCKKYAPEVGCECKPGFLKSSDEDDSKCIKPDECPAGNPCGVNGTFVVCHANCPDSMCPVNDDRGSKQCSPPKPCPSGCACKLNYRKRTNENWTYSCILASDCPAIKCTRPNEIYSPCPSACLRENCEDINNQPSTCNTLVFNCQPQCICKKGHFRNDKGICIPAKQCPIPPVCSDPNAETVECASQCQPTCATPNPGPCILSCKKNGCVCKKGFILSAKGGKCIPVDKCPKDAPCNGDSNAVIKANPLACPSTCDAPNAQPYCEEYAPEVGCECKPGFLKSSDDYDAKCIKPDECPAGNPCGANGTFVFCHANCPDSMCPINDDRGSKQCSPPKPCPSGCACKLNYRKKINYDFSYTCILASDCPAIECTRPNEVYSPCPSACLRENCEDINNQPSTCNTLVLNCQPQCICKKGHFRNDKGICIPAKQCPRPPVCSDPNAETAECASQCQPTCATPNPGPCILSCKENGCVCKKGFILSAKGGKCIPVDKCPKDAPCNGDSNAVIKANPLACPSTCDAPNAQPYCKKYAPEVGCECKAGLLKSSDDYDGKCIKPDECPGGHPCGANGTFAYCDVHCPNNICPVNDSRAILPCNPQDPCPSGCACKVNYRKRSYTDNTCILASDCPAVKCTRPNEIYSPCPPACLNENCEDVNHPPVICNTLLLNCQPQCICKKGYFRNDKDICIPAKQCPNYRECSDPNAERVDCAPKPACRPTCAHRNPGPCDRSCTLNECICKKGFILSEAGGRCIPLDWCPVPPIQCRVNEVFSPCRVICPPQSCGSSFTTYNCTGTINYCEPGCDCITDYLRNGTEKDLCIPSNQCPGSTPACGLNEHYETNSNKCDLTCKNLIQQAMIGPCAENSGCFCDDGFARNNNGICVPKKQCPKQITCPVNEVLSECYNTCHTTCKTRIRGDGRVCHLACIDTGCLCKQGYLRHDNGTCVPINQCSPPRCNENEVYSNCGSACESTCQNRGANCTACTLQCVEGCFCRKGYLRADDGSCVAPKHCPPRTCTDPNEVFDECPNTCPTVDSCSNLWSKINCTNQEKCCKPQCRCRDGYYRNNQGKCVTSQQCSTPACGLNEHYETNSNKCDLTCKNLIQQAMIGPCAENSGCFCDDGFARNNNGICVPKKQCPKPITCPVNEVLSECYNTCHTTCKTRIRGDGRVCHLACIDTGCLCKQGYLRHDNGTCVPINQCSPPRCNENEVYSKCGSACESTCQNRGANCTACTLQCVEGCFCRKGYLRADDGSCVAPKHCPPRTCTDPNEVFDECPNTCPTVDSCSNLWSRINCTNREKCCKPQCRCKDGYYRNDQGKCITTQQCINGE